MGLGSAPWIGSSIDDALSQLKCAARVIAQSRPPGWLPALWPHGSSEEEVAARAAQLKKPLPTELVKLYQAVEGVFFDGEHIYPAHLHFLRLSEANWLQGDDIGWLDFEPIEWRVGNYFNLAHATFGDMVLYSETPPGRPSGSIILVDHECANMVLRPDKPNWYTSIVHLADSLAEWLARFAFYGCEKFALCRPEKLEPIHRLYFQDHLRLNPNSNYAKKKLAELSEAFPVSEK